jgi:methylenetetrahydrofolate dehydrogenase (NADP+) / methenyltetrahydrofolate cyclohydrolase
VGRLNVYGIAGVPGIHRETKTLDGEAAAAAQKSQVTAEIRRRVSRGEPAPVLATISVGNGAASEAYVAAKQACAEVGIDSVAYCFEDDATHDRVAECIGSLNSDPDVSGIRPLMPMPKHLNARSLLNLIDPAKDVDGVTAVNMGRLFQGSEGLVPCTPRAILALLDHYSVELDGRSAVVVGRSQLVGRPAAALLAQRNATVTLCHSRTPNLSWECRRANILIVAAGRPKLIGFNDVRHGGVVVDAGIHRTAEGLVGDVDFEAVCGRVQAISPVPGGVGPMTIAALLENTVTAAYGGGKASTSWKLSGERRTYDRV